MLFDIRKIVRFSLQHPWWIIGIWIILSFVGARATSQLALDPLPDFVTDQAQVFAAADGRSADELDQLVLKPLLRELEGIPGNPRIEGLSQPNLVSVTLSYPETGDSMQRRVEITQRMSRLELPAGIRPQLAPAVTPLGEILDFELRAPKGVPLEERRWILQSIVSPALREIEGVLAVNPNGGSIGCYEMLIDANLAAANGVGPEQIRQTFEALDAGAVGKVLPDGRRLQSETRPRMSSSINELMELTAIGRGDAKFRLGDIATIKSGSSPRLGYVTRDGRGEIVIGQVVLTPGANARRIATRVRETLEALKGKLPKGYSIEILYDRSQLTDKTVHTIVENQISGIALVTVMIWLCLWSWRAALIASIVIPISMFATAEAMLLMGIAASLLSLGAIDFGIAIDSTIISLENTLVGSLEAERKRRLEQIEQAFYQVRRSAGLGELAVVVALIPFWFLPGREGQLFRPQVMTFQIVLLSCLVLSLTLVPALAGLFLTSAGHHNTKGPNRFVGTLRRVLIRTNRYRTLGLTLVAAFMATGATIALNTKWELLPKFDEGDLLVAVEQPPNKPLPVLRANVLKIEAELLNIPEVRTVYTRSGSAEMATDPMPLHESDMYVLLKPKSEWRDGLSKGDLLDEIRNRLDKLKLEIIPDIRQPMEWRTEEAIGGEASDIAVVLQSDADPKQLRREAGRIATLLKAHTQIVAESVRLEPSGDVLTIDIRPNPAKLNANRMHAHLINETLAWSLGKKETTVEDKNGRIMPVYVRWQNSPQSLGEVGVLPVIDSEKTVPLSEVADITQVMKPVSIRRLGTQRTIVVHATLKDHLELEKTVADLEKSIDMQVLASKGIRLTFGGKYAELERGRSNLYVACLIALPLVFSLIFFGVGQKFSLTLLAIVVGAVAASGGIIALQLVGLPVSISASLGLIAAVGVSQQFFLVWAVTTEQDENAANDTDRAVEISMLRLRPVIMTALTDIFGFLPIALSSSAGAEIQQPLATAVIGGVLATTIMVIAILPSLYTLVGKRR